jgi:hypothetical protein
MGISGTERQPTKIKNFKHLFWTEICSLSKILLLHYHLLLLLLLLILIYFTNIF